MPNSFSSRGRTARCVVHYKLGQTPTAQLQRQYAVKICLYATVNPEVAATSAWTILITELSAERRHGALAHQFPPSGDANMAAKNLRFHNNGWSSRSPPHWANTGSTTSGCRPSASRTASTT